MCDNLTPAEKQMLICSKCDLLAKCTKSKCNFKLAPVNGVEKAVPLSVYNKIRRLEQRRIDSEPIMWVCNGGDFNRRKLCNRR